MNILEWMERVIDAKIDNQRNIKSSNYLLFYWQKSLFFLLNILYFFVNSLLPCQKTTSRMYQYTDKLEKLGTINYNLSILRKMIWPSCNV